MALRVGVAGLGTVGGGICQILKSNAPLIAARCGGRAVELAAVADIVKPEGLDISGATFYDDAVVVGRVDSGLRDPPLGHRRLCPLPQLCHVEALRDFIHVHD